MHRSAHLLRTAVLVVLAAGVWALALAAMAGHAAPHVALGLALAGALVVAARGGSWTLLGVGAGLASVAVLTLGETPASLMRFVNSIGELLVTAGGARVALELVRAKDASARPAVIGIMSFLAADVLVLHDASSWTFSPFAGMLPAAALLFVAYGAWRPVAAAAPAVVAPARLEPATAAA